MGMPLSSVVPNTVLSALLVWLLLAVFGRWLKLCVLESSGDGRKGVSGDGRAGASPRGAAAGCSDADATSGTANSVVEGVSLMADSEAGASLRSAPSCGGSERRSRESFVLLGGLALAAAVSFAGMAAFVQVQPSSGVEVGFATLAWALVLALATGLFEEGLLRGVLFRLFAKGLTDRKDPLLAAAIASSLLFAALHVTSDIGGLGRFEGFDQVIAVASLAAKAAQAFAFGLVMSALYVRWSRTYVAWRGLVGVSFVHAAYDVVAFAPFVYVNGAMPDTYALPDPVQLAFAVATAVMLAVSAVYAWRLLKRFR